MKVKYYDVEKELSEVIYETPKGWHPLVEELVEDLYKLGWDGEVHQIKEKFGGLRFYIGSTNDKIFNRISQAEEDSFKVCEVCGSKKYVTTKPKPGTMWIVSRCEECFKK